MGSGAARQRASRRKARQAAPTTTSQTATWGSSTPLPPSFDPASRAHLLQGWQSFPGQDRSFSLNQEARNTHRSNWNESNRLRNNAVQFVSGGNLGQDDPDRDREEPDIVTKHINPVLEDTENAPSTDNVPSVRAEEHNLQPQSKHEDDTLDSPSIGVHMPITKQVEEMDLSFTNPNPSLTLRRSNSASSISSSEVILFGGRGNPQRKRKQSSTPPTPQPSTPGFFNPNHELKTCSSKPPPASGLPSRLKPEATDSIPNQTIESTSRYPVRSPGVVASEDWTKKLNGSSSGLDQPGSNDRPGRGRRTYLGSYDDDGEEEEILRDYIANVMKQELEDEASSDGNDHHRDQREYGPDDINVPVVASTDHAKVITGLGEDWSSDDLRDFDELDTSDDELTDIGGIFSRRERASGLQYLVTPKGQSADFAKWILQEKLVFVKAREMIVAFEEAHPEAADVSDEDEDEDEGEDDEDQWNDSVSDDSEEQALNALVRDHESEHNENERILNHTSQMTDAEIARILNKQAELGIDTDNIVLFDGAFEQSKDFIPFSTKTHISSRTRSKQKRRSQGRFPSAEAFADVLDQDPYNGFDVMDFERPSLKPKKKGRKSANGLPFELDDDELAGQLAQSWANDRSKKAMKKAEREELRQAGLLGPKAGKGRVDLQTKYRNFNGMDMEQVKAEVRLFLLDEDREALALASMGSSQRAQVHLLAKALRLKSHSQGKGDNRFPILTKTEFSGRYDDDTISHIDALLAKRKFSTNAFWGKRDQAFHPKKGLAGWKARKGGGGGVAAGGASYMDGDVVGASAPELGSENRGRAMLEKMGWTEGTGIGKVGNKGSVEVIKHVVKNSKAGLG